MLQLLVSMLYTPCSNYASPIFRLTRYQLIGNRQCVCVALNLSLLACADGSIWGSITQNNENKSVKHILNLLAVSFLHILLCMIMIIMVIKHSVLGLCNIYTYTCKHAVLHLLIHVCV